MKQLNKNKMKKLIENSVILITGGTGTFGQAFLKYIINFNPKEVRIFSRDEKKHYELQNKYSQYNNIKYYIGDIRDMASVEKVMHNVDYVFHAAAMKQVPICEQNPIEALRTNVIGSNNVLEAAIQAKVKKVICISTDKAVEPTSIMGLTKLYMEKIALSKAREQSYTNICIARFCNLIYSNGSVVPLFVSQINKGEPITITDPEMSRYFISIKQAIELIEQVFLHGQNGEIYIKKGKACLIRSLAQAVVSLMGETNYPVKVIGARAGEKKHESLYTEEESQRLKLENDCIIITDYLTNNIFLKDELSSIEEIKKMILENIEFNS